MNAHCIAYCFNQFLRMFEMLAHRLPRLLGIVLCDLCQDVPVVRQALVDSWPGDVADSAAQKDWGFSPRHGLAEALADYLVPAMKRRYPQTVRP